MSEPWQRGREYVLPARAPQTSAAPAGGPEVESVSSLTQRIKSVLESSLPPCWVRGEISNLRTQASGHLYFSLKDAAAQLACVMFRGDALRSGAAALRDGGQVLLFGEIGVYEPRGCYQLVVRAVLDDGVGRLQQEFERLKQRLAAEGLFDATRKKPIPALPRVIGFITSPTGAAIQDFIRILKRRRWFGRLVVLPAKVQGDGAAAEMVRALELAQRLSRSAKGPRFDLLLIGRGGGSLEDLWAFNDESLVRAVAACPLPVISAVGHEIDFTLCDFAADLRAETPSAAAELISSSFLDGVERLRLAAEGTERALDTALRQLRDGLEIARGKLERASPAARIERAYLQLDDAANRLAAAARHSVHSARHRLSDAAARLAHVRPTPHLARIREQLFAAGNRLGREFDRNLADRARRLTSLADRLHALGPDAVLRRGYVIVRDGAGAPIVSRGALRSGERITAQFHDGDARLAAE